jgi:hypothetical protein
MSNKQDDEHRVTNSGVERVCDVEMMSEIIQFPPRGEEQRGSKDGGGVEVQEGIQWVV